MIKRKLMKVSKRVARLEIGEEKKGLRLMLDREKWGAAKLEAYNILVECAKMRRMITYSELCRRITALKIDPHTEIGYLLGEIAVEDRTVKRGMLTALVVHKIGDLSPGGGFFEIAEEMGIKVGDRDEFWINEVKKVFKDWTKKSEEIA